MLANSKDMEMMLNKTMLNKKGAAIAAPFLGPSQTICQASYELCLSQMLLKRRSSAMHGGDRHNPGRLALASQLLLAELA